MPVTQQDIDALKSAIARRQEAQITFSDGRHVTYRTVAELERALAFAERQVPGRVLRQTRVQGKKGW
jgi:hypothetical protein